MLIGEYFHSIDEKGRMNFPVKLRDDLGEQFVVTRWLDDCLIVFSQNEMENIVAKLRSQPMGSTRDVQRYIFANATTVEPDKQGRILIPNSLREKAGLKRDIVVIGVMDHAEIWDKERWETKSDSVDAAVIDEKMNELGI